MNTKTPESEIAEARKTIDTFYTPLDEALELLRGRQANEKLRAAVADFHRPHPPDFLPNVPFAYWARHISTPNQEFALFASAVSATGLQPLCVEYTCDIFVSRNRDKYHLCRPCFEVRPNHYRSTRITKFGQIEGQRLCDIKMANGMSLPAFHHALMRCAFPDYERHLRDCSHWFSAARRIGDSYLHYLALFICYGILFENFLPDDPEERRFTRERMLPSFVKAVELFGVKPLIVPLLPRETENDKRWRSHPGALHPVAISLLHGNKRKGQIHVPETSKIDS